RGASLAWAHGPLARDRPLHSVLAASRKAAFSDAPTAANPSVVVDHAPRCLSTIFLNAQDRVENYLVHLGTTSKIAVNAGAIHDSDRDRQSLRSLRGRRLRRGGTHQEKPEADGRLGPHPAAPSIPVGVSTARPHACTWPGRGVQCCARDRRMSVRSQLAAAVAGGVLACSNEPPPIPADRSILLWYGSAAQQQNQRNLPGGFSGPDEHACAADTSRTYLAELFVQHDIQVKWHWAPIVGGPNRDKPTLEQPEFSLAGTLADATDSTDH